MPSSDVHKLVDPWQWEGIFWACLIEVCIVNTDPPHSIWLHYHYHIGQPFRVVGFPNELGFEELVNLFADQDLPLKVDPTVFLNDRFMSGVDIEPVEDD